MNLTLNGFVAKADGSLDWHFSYWDGELCEGLCQQLRYADLLLLGGNTYRAMAEYWGKQINNLSLPREDFVLAYLMNSLRKAVVSKTIVDSLWDGTVFLRGELTKEIQQLKAVPGQNIVILGSEQLFSSLVQLNLIDRYELWIHPILIKEGKSLFSSLTCHLELRLISSRKLNSGVVYQCYEPVLSSD